jgi:hypothetical protein
MKVVYISAPYRSNSINGIHENIEIARRVALRYWRKGFAVICPHLNTAYFDGAISDEEILAGDIEILKRCDGIVMCGNWKDSEGARNELVIAQAQKKIIFYED